LPNSPWFWPRNQTGTWTVLAATDRAPRTRITTTQILHCHRLFPEFSPKQRRTPH